MASRRAIKDKTAWVAELVALCGLGIICTTGGSIGKAAPAENRPDLHHLIQNLRNPGTSVAHASAQALAEMGGRAQAAVPALVEAASKRRDIRSVCIFAIGRIGEALGDRFGAEEAENALPVLTSALNNENDDDIREVAAYAMGRLAPALSGSYAPQETSSAVSALISHTSDGKPKVQRAAVEALGLFREYDLLSGRGEDAIQALIEALKTSNDKSGVDYEHVQIDCSAALRKFGPAASSAVSGLVSALQSGNPIVERAAAFALAGIGSSAAAAPLGAALKESDVEVKKAAAFALGSIHPAAVATVPALIDALRDRNPDVRATVSSALGSYSSDKEAFPPLVAGLGDKDPNVRVASANTAAAWAENNRGSDPEQLVPQLEQGLRAIAAILRTIPQNDVSRRSLMSAQTRIQHTLNETPRGIFSRLWRHHKLLTLVFMLTAFCALLFLMAMDKSVRFRQAVRRFLAGWTQNVPAEGVMGRIQRWYSRLYQDAYDWKPGYFGGIPYLLVLRCGIAIAIWLRFQLHSRHLVPNWTDWAVLILILFAFIFHWRPKNTYYHTVYVVLVALDIIVISTAYWHTYNKNSDFFLFYCLPIFTAAEFLGSRWVAVAFAAASVAFAGVLFDMPAGSGYSNGTPFQIFARVFLPREAFYLLVSLIWALRLRRERDSRQRSMTRQYQMQKLLACKREIDSTFAIPEVLRVIVEHAHRDLQARCAAITLAVEQNTVPSWPLIQWAGQYEPKTLEFCQNSVAGPGKPPGDTAAVPIMVRERCVGALVVNGLDSEQRANSDEYLRSLAELVVIALERQRLFEAVRDIGARAAKGVELNQELESILDNLVDKMCFDYAIISLVDIYQDEIRTVRGRNVPPGWIESSSHSLKSDDILVSIATTKKTETLDEWDTRFKLAIWRRYRHDRFARVFAPIVDPDSKQNFAVGVIEAGCLKERRDTVARNVDEVTNLGVQAGPSIAASLPQTLLELMANRAVELIGADSASLHVFRGDREFLVAGTLLANKQFLRKHPPRPNGIGREAMRTGKRQVFNDLTSTNPALRASGVHAMAAFPLTLTKELSGVLYIHFWHPHGFSDAELELASAFVPHMEVAIQNWMLLQDFSKVDEKAWMITGLHNVIESLGQNLGIHKLLLRLAADALYILEPKNVTLYQYSQETRNFKPAVTDGRFEDPGVMKTQVLADDIVTKVVEQGESRFISDTFGPEGQFLRQPRTDGIQRARFVVREDIKSCAILVLKVPNDGEIVGCLFANYDQEKNFESPATAGLIKLANSLASSAAVAIKAARLHEQDLETKQADIERRESEIEALRVIDRAIVSRGANLTIREICTVILDEVLRVLGPRGDVTLGDVTIWNPAEQRLEVMAERGFPEGWVDSQFELGNGIVGCVAQSMQPALIEDVRSDSRYRRINDQTLSELAVPIVDVAAGPDGLLVGVINVEHRAVGAFRERDKAFLETLAVQMAIAGHTIQLRRKLQRERERVLSLSKVAAWIQDSSLQADDILDLILTGVTAGPGLGFSRALFFELADDGSELRGRSGVGPLTSAAAHRVWEGLKGVSLDDLVKARKDGHRPPFEDMISNEFVRTLRIPLERLPAGIRNALNGDALDVHALKARDFGGTGLQLFYNGAGDCAIRCVPLKGAESTVGVLLIDNRFAPEETKLDSTLESILPAFAELAAMSLEGARLRARLADEKRLANWQAASSGAAHALEHCIRQIDRLLTGMREYVHTRDLPSARATIKDLQKALDGAYSRAERIKTFWVRRQPRMNRVDIGAVLQETIKKWEPDLNCSTKFYADANSICVRADEEVVPDMFVDLLLNAAREMRGQEDAEIRVRVSADLDQQRVTIEVEDNGPGIPASIREKVFEPYFTMSGGTQTGLGLTGIQRMVEDHGGEIWCAAAIDGRGARFTIQLPLLEAVPAVTAAAAALGADVTP